MKNSRANLQKTSKSKVNNIALMITYKRFSIEKCHLSHYFLLWKIKIFTYIWILNI